MMASIERTAISGSSGKRCVGAVEGGPLNLWVIRVTFGQGPDQGLFPRTGTRGQHFGLGDRCHGRIPGSFVHGRVDIGTQHKSLTPVAHGTVLVLSLCLTESTQS